MASHSHNIRHAISEWIPVTFLVTLLVTSHSTFPPIVSADELFLVKDVNTQRSPYSRKVLAPSHIVYMNGYYYFNDLYRDFWNGTKGGLYRCDGQGTPWELVYPSYFPEGHSFRIGDLVLLNDRLLMTVPRVTLELFVSDGTLSGTRQITEGLDVGSRLVFMGDHAYFSSSSNPGLWRTDGSTSGTTAIKLIDTSYAPRDLIEVDGTLFFRSTSNSRRNELWKSDGTGPGTVPLKDLGKHTNIETDFAAFNGLFAFTNIDDYSHPTIRRSLWISNGTSEGTFPLLVNAHVSEICSSGDRLFFSVADGDEDLRGLWITDGTTTGTVQIKSSEWDPIQGGAFSPSSLTDVNGTLFFVATVRDFGAELWKSDGTASGTVPIKNIHWNPFSNYGSHRTYYQNMFNANGLLLFSAFEYSLVVHSFSVWRSDGTTEGTYCLNVKPYVYALSDQYNQYPHPMAYCNGPDGLTYFVASDANNGSELRKTDGTESGTLLASDNRDSDYSSDPQFFTRFNDTLYFTATDGVHGRELYRSDGTSEGTYRITDILPNDLNYYVHFWKRLNNRFLFRTADSASVNGPLYYWASDGTEQGTVQLTNTNLRTNHIYPNSYSFPESTAQSGEILYYAARDLEHGTELWRTDGTPGGTGLVKDAYPGPRDSNPLSITNLNGAILFTADTEDKGRELWKSDGTASGTAMIKDVVPGEPGMEAGFFTDLGDVVIFATDNQTSATQLWRSDGTAEGTWKLANLTSITNHHRWEDFVKVGQTLYYANPTTSSLSELWLTNGQAEGTRKILNEDGAYYTPLAALYDRFLIFNRRFNGLPSIWRTDGTPDGTFMLIDSTDVVKGYPDHAYTDNVVYFAPSDVYLIDTRNEGIWTTNGTIGGTVRLVTENRFTRNRLINDRLMFYCDNDRLWRTDGTPEGTFPIFEGGVYLWAESYGNVYFTHGNRLWKSDGTVSGTMRVSDFIVGDYSWWSVVPRVVGNALLFSARSDASTGTELWGLNLSSCSGLHWRLLP